MAPKAARAPELIVIGNACADLFIPPHAPPPPGGLVRVPRFVVEVGGNGANTAITAARLGVRTSFAGTIGDDLFARHVLDCLRADEVDVSLVEVAAGVGGPTTLVRNHERGERSFVHHPGSNDRYRLPRRALETPCAIFHFAAPELLGPFFPSACLEAARELRCRGRRLSLDVIEIDAQGLDPVAAHRPLLELVEMAFPNESEARAISGRAGIDDAIRYFHDCGVEVVAVKRGAQGAVVSWGGHCERVPAEEVVAVDTCGAGDNFAGGYLAGVLRGLDPLACTRLGCALGAMCVAKQGAVAGTADRARVKRVLERFGLESVHGGDSRCGDGLDRDQRAGRES